MQKQKNKMSLLLGLVPVANADLTTIAQNAQGVSKKADVLAIALQFINFAIMAIGVLGVIMFIVAGFLYMTASGDQGKVDRAKSTMTYAAVGLAVAVLGFVVVATVQRYLVSSS